MGGEDWSGQTIWRPTSTSYRCSQDLSVPAEVNRDDFGDSNHNTGDDRNEAE